MSEAELPERAAPDREVTVDDVRELCGASTPHFALQLRNRLRKLTAGLPTDDPARIEAQREVRRLEELATEGAARGRTTEHERPLPSLAMGDSQGER